MTPPTQSGLRDSGLPWIGPVPAHWPVQRLTTVARLESGHTPSRQRPEYWENCTIPWFSLADVWQIRDAGRMHVSETAEMISELGMANSAARLLPAGTVILSRTASVGFSGVLGRPMATTQDFVNWVCGPALVPEYLCYVLRAMKPEFQRLMSGSTHKTIYMPSVRAFRVPVPPVEEQRELVALLDRAATACAVAEREAAALSQALAERRRAVIDAAVTGTDYTDAPSAGAGAPLPAGWRWGRVKDVVQRVEQGWSPECESRLARDGEWGVLKAGAVNGGVFREDEHKALPGGVSPVESLEVRPGDVLVSRASGSRELVGSAGLVGECRPRLMLCDKLFRLRLRPGVVDPRFLVRALNSSVVRAQVERLVAGSSGLALNIGQADLRELRIALPPAEEQRRIADRLETELAQLELLRAEATTQAEALTEYRTALVREAVAGRLHVAATAHSGLASFPTARPVLAACR